MIPPPSELQFIPFPPFGIKWFATKPIPLLEKSPTTATCTAFAICGGGGAAKTGFANCVHIVISSEGPGCEDEIIPSEGADGKDEVLSHERTVDIDTGSEVGVAVTLHQVGSMLLVLVAIGNGFALYFVPLGNRSGHGNGGESAPKSVCMVEETFGEESGCEAVSFMPDGSAFATGYDNGKIRVFTLDYNPPPSSNTLNKNNSNIKDNHKVKVIEYCELHAENARHIKAIDTLQFHPTNPRILASCAKDGTCRIWDLVIKQCIDVLNCKIYPSNKPPPEDKKITDPKPGQLLVRGCAYGDPHGQTLYTVQSGRRGAAFLSVWQLVQPFPTPVKDPTQQLPPSQPVFQEVMRKVVASVPISAMSLSGDYKTLALGDTAGTVTLYDAFNQLKPIKSWKEAHETPVTCIAARPAPGNFPGDFPGEERTGVTVDVMTASFDNKLLFLTKQRNSRLYVPGPGHGTAFYLLNLYLIVGILFVSMVSYDACQEEMMVLSSGDLDYLEPVKECLVHTVILAKMDRAGVSEVPM